jgi:hypothetical protein
MSGPDLPPGGTAGDDLGDSRTTNFLRRQLPFIAVLGLAVAGVAYANVSRQPLVGYWEFMALAIGVLCIFTEWARLDEKQARVRLIWTQALHWAAVLITMNIMLLSNVQRLLPTPAMSLVLLSLLALGTFLAGLNLLSLQIGFLGLALALAVPAIAWLKNSMLFFILGAVFLIGLAMTIWLSQGDGRSVSKSHDPSVRR